MRKQVTKMLNRLNLVSAERCDSCVQSLDPQTVGAQAPRRYHFFEVKVFNEYIQLTSTADINTQNRK